MPTSWFPGPAWCGFRPSGDAGSAGPGSAWHQPMFDEAALARTLADSHALDAAATTEHISAALTAHHGGWISDDTALLALRVPPQAAVMPPSR